MRFVVVGGGVCGVSAVQRLLELAEEAEEAEEEGEGGRGEVDDATSAALFPLSITLVSPSPVLKAASNVQRLSAVRETFDVAASDPSALLSSLPRSGRVSLTFHAAHLSSLSPSTSTVQLSPVHSAVSSSSPSSPSSSLPSAAASLAVPYDRLLLAMGASPAQPFQEGERVHVLRDVDTIARLSEALRRSIGEGGEAEQRQRTSEGGYVLVVGNGGIAMEVVHALSSFPLLEGQRARLVWVVKDDFVCSSFLDRTSSAFLLPLLFPHSDPVLEQRSFDDQQAERNRTGAIDRERRRRAAAAAADGVAAAAHHGSAPLRTQREETDSEDGGRGGGGGVCGSSGVYGGALGPHWQRHLHLPERADGDGGGVEEGTAGQAKTRRSPVALHFNTIVTHVINAPTQRSDTQPLLASSSLAPSSSYPSHTAGPPPSPSPLLRVSLSNGLVYDCALLVSATGVVPNTAMLSCSAVALSAADGDGVVASASLRTSAPRVYAAGDCASVSFSSSPHFFQMRLWSQARTMGRNAATSMWEDAIARDDEAEGDDERHFYPLFLHELHLMGEKVILMGLFNEDRWRAKQRERQQEEEDGEGGGAEAMKVLMRVRAHGDGEAGHYVKVIMTGGRVQGCTLIGDTELEEVMENLIVNQLDISHLGDDWLHADVDLQDFFD